MKNILLIVSITLVCLCAGAQSSIYSIDSVYHLVLRKEGVKTAPKVVESEYVTIEFQVDSVCSETERVRRITPDSVYIGTLDNPQAIATTDILLVKKKPLKEIASLGVIVGGIALLGVMMGATPLALLAPVPIFALAGKTTKYTKEEGWYFCSEFHKERKTKVK